MKRVFLKIYLVHFGRMENQMSGHLMINMIDHNSH